MKSGIIVQKRRAFGLMAGFCLSLAAASPTIAQELPPVPDAIQNAGKVRVGTKCDYPPEGFMDKSGALVGVEVAMAHQIAKYAFGDKAEAEITCVTTANRVPALLGNKVDLLIATMAIDPERAKVVDFTQPYAWASQGAIVRAEDAYKAPADLKDKPVVFVKGALAISYFKENFPEVKQLQLDSVSDSLQALMQKRVAAYAHDTPILMTLARKNPKLRLLDGQFKITLRAGSVRPGEKEWLAFVNASMSKMAAAGLFRKWFETYANDEDMEVKLNFWDMSKKPAE